ncbi:MAG: ABC transporter permease [Candidatus Methanomethyliaceae archaeon]
MIFYCIKRLLLAIVTIFVASFVIYTAVELVPGDPVLAMFFPRIPSEEIIKAVRTQLNLDKPFIIRYAIYIHNVIFHGDFGTSFKQQKAVLQIITENISATVELAFFGIGVGLLLGIGAGMVAGLLSDSFFDRLLMPLSLTGISMPSFWLGILLVLLFSVKLRWFPTSGTGGFQRLCLPGLTLGLYGAGYMARFSRASVVEIKYQEYITTARAKGLPEYVVAFRHVLRNASIPILTAAGILAGYMLGGAAIVETVFGRLGLGHVLINAINNKDYPVVQGLLLFNVIIFSLINLLVDLIYVYIDPRIKYYE